METLLHGEEGASLDFKRDQYAFAAADDQAKSDLLKDIVAFANSWRTGDAFIVIGVEEVRGGRGRPVGVSNHLNDADLQQFVNSKTNRPVQFSYEATSVDGVQVGVIRVEKQDRPTYLMKDYGRLRKHVVYVRRSSSTAEALPDEIHRMGAVDSSKEPAAPVLELYFADIRSKELRGCLLTINPTPYIPMEPRSVRPYQPGGDQLGVAIHSLFSNERYYSQLNSYLALRRSTAPVAFAVMNYSGQTARGVRLRPQFWHDLRLPPRPQRG